MLRLGEAQRRRAGAEEGADDRIGEIEGRTFRDPAKSFGLNAGWTSEYLDYEIDGSGAMHLTYRNDAMTFFRSRAGMFVMLTPGMDWEAAMASYDARNNVEVAFDVFRSELDGRVRARGRPCARDGRLFVKFLALMIRVRMQSVVSA